MYAFLCPLKEFFYHSKENERQVLADYFIFHRTSVCVFKHKSNFKNRSNNDNTAVMIYNFEGSLQ